MNKQTKWYLSISILALILLVLIVVYKNSFKIALGKAGVGEQYIQYIDTGFDNNGNEYRVVFQYMSDNTVKIVHLTKDDFGVWHVTDEAHGPVSDAAYVMMGWMRTASMRRHEVNDPVVFDWEVHNVYGGNNAIKQIEIPIDLLPPNVTVNVFQAGSQYVIHFVSYGGSEPLQQINILDLLNENRSIAQ